MIIPHRLTALTVAALALMPLDTAAQTVGTTTGSIAGRIVDDTGAVAAHATVTATSPALMGKQTTSSGLDGWYRFMALAPGDYHLSFYALGMRVAERRARVALGSVTTVDVTLDVDSVRVGITVAADPQVLDRHSTTVLDSLDSHRLEVVPGARNMLAVLSSSPAVEVPRFEIGGGSGLPGGAYGAYGIRGWNWPMLEGISVSGIFPAGFTLDYGSFDEAAVITAAQGPEWPSPGVHTQVVTKSGGNAYRGTFYVDYEHRDWQAFNIDEKQMALGASGGGGLSPRDVNRLWDYGDVNADAGGFVVKDRLWWYGSMRHQDTSTRLVNFPAKPYATRLNNFGGKATYRVTTGNRLIAFAQAGRNHQPNRLDPFPRAQSRLNPLTAINEFESSTANQLARGLVWKSEWNSVIRNTLLVEARVGRFSTEQQWRPRSSSPRIEDGETLVVLGGNRESERSLDRGQAFATGSYFHDGSTGGHHIRFGAEMYRMLEAEGWLKGYPQNVLHLLRNGAPTAVFLFETPSRSEHGLWTYAGFAGDSWRLRDRLTLNLGVRFDRYRVFLPEQEHPVGSPAARRFAAQPNVVVRNELTPRVGAAFDITGDGRNLVKFTFGQYKLPILIGGSVNANTTEWWTMRQWSDQDGSGLWEPGEEGALLDRRGGSATASVDPNLKPPAITEATAWTEHQLRGSIGLKGGAVWRRAYQYATRQDASRPFAAFNLPRELIDPGPDGAAGTVDDGRTIVVYDLAEEQRGLPPVDVLGNVDAASEYLTVEARASRRTNGRWSVDASFSHTWNRDHSDGYAGQSIRNNLYPLTPNDLINAGRGGRHHFTTWTAKALATYDAPAGIRIVPHLRHQSGQPFGRTFVTTMSYGTVRVLAEPIGSRRMDNITVLDVRVEKTWRMGSLRRVAAFVDVFNSLNVNPEQNVVWSSGPSFLRPLAIVPPRIARIGATVAW